MLGPAPSSQDKTGLAPPPSHLWPFKSWPCKRSRLGQLRCLHRKRLNDHHLDRGELGTSQEPLGWVGKGKDSACGFSGRKRRNICRFPGQGLAQVGRGRTPVFLRGPTLLQRKSQDLQGLNPQPTRLPLPGRSEPPLQRPRNLLARDLQLPLRAGLGGR